MASIRIIFILCVVLLIELISNNSESSAAYKRDPGHHIQWHHSAFQDVKETLRSDVRSMLHSRAEV